jgi:hypothetical protein
MHEWFEEEHSISQVFSSPYIASLDYHLQCLRKVPTMLNIISDIGNNVEMAFNNTLRRLGVDETLDDGGWVTLDPLQLAMGVVIRLTWVTIGGGELGEFNCYIGRYEPS